VYDPAGDAYRITTASMDSRGGYALGPGEVAVKTYRDVLAAYRCHPEPKSLASDGTPCRRDTSGLLSRRAVEALSITHVGKEANLLEEIAAGVIRSEAETLNEYTGRPAHTAPPLACRGFGAVLGGRQRRWCSSCRADHRRRIRISAGRASN
jgi:hypothetical protein